MVIFSRYKDTNNMNSHSDEDIIKGIQAGGRKLEKMVQHLYNRADLKDSITNLIKNHKGSTEDAEDILQEGMSLFVVNIRKNKFQIKSTLKTYLTGICKHLWYNLHRKKETEAKKKSAILSVATLDHTPEDLTVIQEQTVLLAEVLSKLGEKCKEVLGLWSLGYSMKEIATKTGYANDNVVSKTKHKCQKQLVQYLKDRPNLIQQLKEIKR